jgi:hypothetical protein
MLQVHLLEEHLLKRFGERFNVHVIAVASSFAAAVDVLLALGVQEVSDRREDSTDSLSIEEPAIDVLECIF